MRIGTYSTSICLFIIIDLVGMMVSERIYIIRITQTRSLGVLWFSYHPHTTVWLPILYDKFYKHNLITLCFNKSINFSYLLYLSLFLPIPPLSLPFFLFHSFAIYLSHHLNNFFIISSLSFSQFDGTLSAHKNIFSHTTFQSLLFSSRAHTQKHTPSLSLSVCLFFSLFLSGLSVQ